VNYLALVHGFDRGEPFCLAANLSTVQIVGFGASGFFATARSIGRLLSSSNHPITGMKKGPATGPYDAFPGHGL
jgi:hypothetical protein